MNGRKTGESLMKKIDDMARLLPEGHKGNLYRLCYDLIRCSRSMYVSAGIPKMLEKLDKKAEDFGA